VISVCVKQSIPALTLFTFSSENWRRPESEVSFLFGIFLKSLKSEMQALHKNKVRLKIIGDTTEFSEELRNAIHEAETLTQSNSGLALNIAFNYGGRWDIVSATRGIAQRVIQGDLDPNKISEEDVRTHLTLSDCPEPDLLIRTSGEYRISNFLLWQLAYTELYFTDIYWPDFREPQFEEALKAYAERQRRFGASELKYDIELENSPKLVESM
jgi:undecaprenyl diphosphate synthase